MRAAARVPENRVRRRGFSKIGADNKKLYNVYNSLRPSGQVFPVVVFRRSFGLSIFVCRPLRRFFPHPDPNDHAKSVYVPIETDSKEIPGK